MERAELFDLLNKDEVRGKILKDAASLEFSMNIALTFYFTTNKRHTEFEDILLEKLSFEAKISILEKLPYKRKYKSLEHLPVIRHVQRVRNRLAHDWRISDYPKRLKSESWEYLFENWPESYDNSVKQVNNALSRIIQTNEFLDHFAPNKKKT